jgi:hypothetical protein
MLRLLFLLWMLSGCLITTAQVQPKNQQQAEMQQAIEELKREIQRLESEIKQTKDPEEAASLKKELAGLKSMFEKTSRPATAALKPAAVNNQTVKNTPSPITPVIIKQPFTIPTAAQAKDRLLWYKGKKINDSTLVTVKGMLVQYNKNNKQRSVVKIQPLKKTDPFDSVVVEFTKTEKRKEELVNKFVQLKNGFLFYTELRTALAYYDDLNERMAEVLKNTIELPQMPMPVAVNLPLSKPVTKGPFTDEWMRDSIPSGDPERANMKNLIEQQLALAQQLFNQLPPVSSFPPPPLHEKGLCSTCDPELIKKQKKADSVWLDQYQGKEQRIAMLVLGAERQRALLGMEEGDASLLDKLLQRGAAKATILYERYGNNFRSSKAVMQVILGLERQIQLLGFSETIVFNGMDMVTDKLDQYEQYLNEQIQAKNHDFVLNLSSHIGALRQRALLGRSENPGEELNDVIKRWLNYNRFELVIESDFIVEQRDSDGELQFKATGALATKQKVYGMLIPDSCKYKMIPYNTDLSKAGLEDVTIEMQVRSGVKTIKDENDRLVNYSYTGAPFYLLMFPDFKIDFCSTNQPDTAWLHSFTSGTGVPVTTGSLAYQHSKSYQIDFLMMANLLFVTNELPNNEQQFEKLGEEIFGTIGGFQTGSSSSKLEQLKLQYEGKTQMDNHRMGIQNLVNDKKSVIVFTANNRQTVVTDKFTDTKRKLEEEELELTRGMIHLKIVHAAL